MVSAANNKNARPVWFVTGGRRWAHYVENNYWRHWETHGDEAPTDEILKEMLPGDRIAIKADYFYRPGVIGVWATGEIQRNNHDDSLAVMWTWPVTLENTTVRNCRVGDLNVSTQDCVWRIVPDSDTERALIKAAFDLPDDTDTPNTEPQNSDSSTYQIADIITDGCFLDPARLETMLQRLADKRNIILQGPPGTGKTWLAKRLAYALAGSKDDDRVRPLQFHPNMSYEDFVRGWRPAGAGDDGVGRLELVDGPLPRMIADARQNPDAQYVMVIEEINRGNPAQIFGEMLTLLESDKRNPGEAMALAYPRDDAERVHIPPNVYVIGTMNLADRSLALVDFALRRRFAFFDLEPTLGRVWRNWVSANAGIPDDFLAGVERRLTTLNDQIAADPTLGPQFRIGHSVVTPPPGADIPDPPEWFRQAVATEIAPLLREYWFDNPKAADDAQTALLAGLPQ